MLKRFRPVLIGALLLLIGYRATSLGLRKYHNMRDRELPAAVDIGDSAGVETLLRRGANTDVRGIGWSTMLMRAAYLDRTNIVKSLLAHGANVNSEDAYGDTALMRAASAGTESVVQLLLNAGARVNVKDSDGLTALAMAERFNHETVAARLKQSGAVE